MSTLNAAELTASTPAADAPGLAKSGDSLSLEQMECICEIHILVIDDDETTCRVVRDALAHNDFRIRTISDCTKVQAAIEHHGPLHLVVLDYVLPSLTPEQVLVWLQEHRPDAEIIVITGYPTVEGAQAALRARVYDYITKPFPLIQLRQTVMKCLESRGLLRMTADALREAVGAVIRDRRKALDLTLADLVKKSGVSLGYLSQIELGRNSASIETLYRICLALNIRLTELFANLQKQ